MFPPPCLLTSCLQGLFQIPFFHRSALFSGRFLLRLRAWFKLRPLARGSPALLSNGKKGGPIKSQEAAHEVRHALPGVDLLKAQGQAAQAAQLLGRLFLQELRQEGEVVLRPPARPRGPLAGEPGAAGRRSISSVWPTMSSSLAYPISAKYSLTSCAKNVK